MAFTSRRSYASAVLGVVILSVCPSVRPSHACFLTNPKNLLAIFCIPHERAILLVKCDFSYSCAAADKISTDSRARAVSLRQLSYLFDEVTDKNKSALFMAHGVDTAYCYWPSSVVSRSVCHRAGNGSMGHGSWVKWVTKIGWVTWVMGH